MAELYTLDMTALLHWVHEKSKELSVTFHGTYVIITVIASPEIMWLVRDKVPLDPYLALILLSVYFRETYGMGDEADDPEIVA